MPDYVALLGAESVANAGRSISSAAETIQRSAGYIEESLRRHQLFLDDWLLRFEAALERLADRTQAAPAGGSDE